MSPHPAKTDAGERRKARTVSQDPQKLYPTDEQQQQLRDAIVEAGFGQDHFLWRSAKRKSELSLFSTHRVLASLASSLGSDPYK